MAFNENNSEHKLLVREGYDVHYFISGNPAGETLVFLHPAFANHHAFSEQVAYFKGQYRIITIDMLGHGLSQPERTGHKIDETADHILSIFKQEKITHAHLVGVSLGSLLAQHFALQFPEQTLSLTVVGGYDISANNAEVNKAQRKENLKWLLSAIFSMDKFRKHVAEVSTNYPQTEEAFFQMSRSFYFRSFRYLSGMQNVVQIRENGQIKTPLLIVVGDKDIPLARKTTRQFHKKAKGSSFVMIPASGHCCNMDNPTYFNRTLNEFISKNNPVFK